VNDLTAPTTIMKPRPVGSPAEHVLESRHSIETLDQLEEKAEELVEKLEHAITVKLVELRPLIATVKDGFNRLLRGPHTGRTRIMGCQSFREFCPMKLHRSYKTVMAVLHGYEAKRKGKRTTVKLESRHRAQPIPKPDLDRIVGLGGLVLQLTDAESKQDKAAEARATEQIKMWVQADRKVFERGGSGAQMEVLELKREIFRTDLLVANLLSDLERLDEERTLPADVMNTMNLLRQRLQADAAKLGFDLADAMGVNKKAARAALVEVAENRTATS